MGMLGCVWRFETVELPLRRLVLGRVGMGGLAKVCVQVEGSGRGSVLKTVRLGGLVDWTVGLDCSECL